MAGRSYGTDPYGIIARGDPSARGSSSVSVGRVGNAVRDYSRPGRSFGSGVGATVSMPVASNIKKKASGGAAKKSGCDVKAYGDMIKKAAGGKVQTSSDTARKLATEMGGMKKGGKPKSGLAVMIAIGAPMKGMKKPVKKAAGGVGKMRKGMCDAPEKLARGGAGKVRKGMMSPSGQILQAVKPKMK